MTSKIKWETSGTPPLVRGRILVPLLNAFRNSDHSIDDLLDCLFLSFSGLNDPDCFIPHDTVYAVFEAVAKKTSYDFPALVGQSIDWPHFVPFGKELLKSRTLADFVAKYCILIGRDSNSVNMSLNINGKSAILMAKRTFTPSVSPAYMDAYQVSRWITYIHSTARKQWAADSVLVRLNRPELLPAYFFGVKAIGNGLMGYSIRFPSEWLLCDIAAGPDDCILPSEEDIGIPVPADLLASVRSVAVSMVDRSHLTVSDLAEACGFREAALNHRLATYQTSLSRIISDARHNRAKQLLAVPNLSVGEIAGRLGYSDATALTRAFKKWTGQTPSEFRTHLVEPTEF